MCKRAFCIILILALLPCCCAEALNREELRAAYGAIASLRSDDLPYAEEPDPEGFSAIGAVSPDKLQDALNCLNFIRWIAGVGEVRLSEIYNLRCQNAALLLAANDEISHNPAQPAGMHADLYESALLGAQGSNLACLNWMSPDLLIDAVEYFVRDDGEMNLSTLGHRRWLLSPAMAETGFGLAGAESGASYIAMYAVDDGNAAASWEHVAWPAGGAFPVELMRRDLAWSLSLSAAAYDLAASRPVVTLTEETSGASFRFDPLSGSSDGYCAIDITPVGGGGCIIFRPYLEGAGIDEYQQNQSWTVRISGLIRTDGRAAEISYRSEMVSLYPQDAVNVEVSHTEAQLHAGESMQLTAQVIPAYADNLSVRWISSDGSVAMVTAEGMVTALGEGSCLILAESANGRQDVCALTVTAE